MKDRLGWIVLIIIIAACWVASALASKNDRDILQFEITTLRATSMQQAAKLDRQREALRCANSLMALNYPGARMDFLTIE